jgi:uncharacterized protein DUF5135
MATTARAGDFTVSRSLDTAEEAGRTPGVKIWAAVGALFLAFYAWIVIRWVTGPYFERVENTVSEPPGWMKLELTLWETLSIPAALFVLWRFVVRPWMRDRTLGVDGLLVLAFACMWVQDPWSSAGNHWFVYNTEMLNFGSWVHDIPWWSSYGEPGAMTSEPILFTPAAYVYIMLIGVWLGTWVMRRAKRRWPQLKPVALIATCYGAMCLFDIVIEGIIWLPLGVFEYPGGHWSIFPDTYHKYPLNEMFTIAGTFTAISALRYFTNDRGQTLAERGVDQVRGSNTRKVGLRALAVIGAVQVLFLATYGLPNTFIGFNSTKWPADLQKRSYFTNNLCGVATDRFCPGPNYPHIREKSTYPNTDGKVTVPEGVEPPKLVPFDKGKPGPEDG